MSNGVGRRKDFIEPEDFCQRHRPPRQRDDQKKRKHLPTLLIALTQRHRRRPENRKNYCRDQNCRKKIHDVCVADAALRLSLAMQQREMNWRGALKNLARAIPVSIQL